MADIIPFTGEYIPHDATWYYSTMSIYGELEITEDYEVWIKRYIKEYGLEEGTGYIARDYEEPDGHKWTHYFLSKDARHRLDSDVRKKEG